MKSENQLHEILYEKPFYMKIKLLITYNLTDKHLTKKRIPDKISNVKHEIEHIKDEYKYFYSPP